MFKWCINELKHNAESIRNPSHPPPTFVFNGDVYKSDTALSSDFKRRLQCAVAAFEASILEDRKDWHPNTDEKVWDLVHPSLFPVVFGRSRILMGHSVLGLGDCISRCGEGVLLPVPSESEAPTPTFSRDFQWMPCEVDISGPTARLAFSITHDTALTLIEGLRRTSTIFIQSTRNHSIVFSRNSSPQLFRSGNLASLPRGILTPRSKDASPFTTSLENTKSIHESGLRTQAFKQKSEKRTPSPIHVSTIGD